MELASFVNMMWHSIFILVPCWLVGSSGCVFNRMGFCQHRRTGGER